MLAWVCYKTCSRTAEVFGPCATVFRSSSMAEHSAVNRRVVGSSPTCGANSFWVYVLENPRGRFYVGQTEGLTARVAFRNRTDNIDGNFTRKNGPWKLVWSGPRIATIRP